MKRVPADLPRLGFLGVGWIGRHRLEAVAASGLADIAWIADPDAGAVASAAELAPHAARGAGLEDLDGTALDGLVIATPSALHADQAMAAFDRGLAVFCQKPLARTGAEARRVVEAAHAADRLLGVDLSYRQLTATRELRRMIRDGALGEIYAAELVFHNAYGPAKAWCFDRALSGGGCLMDLGVHLVDLALWMLDFPEVEAVDGRLFAGGRRLAPGADAVEDFATARLDLAGGATVSLACSWHLPAGRDAVIRAAFYGTRGGAAIENVDGSFYDFRGERYDGRTRTPFAEPPDAWGGRTAVTWASRLGSDRRFHPSARRFAEVAGILDRVYGC